MQLTWKDIPVIPNQTEFLDIVLNRTQRKTPTVIRPGFKISRIRAFYMRKVRFTADGFTEKLQEIVDNFPKINDIHPFHRDLLNTLYDKDHYKISLGALSRSKGLVEQVSRDYVRLLKFGQSLFQCKQLKRAALGRMATIMKRLKDPLVYLEQVRQHLGRLPSIDPNTRTLLICGYPNVGKSSFLRSITRADVEVQPYAFTTKSLFVGHFDYKYLRFQAIDTPGILDRPHEDMTTIEMQSIYAIAHVRSCVLYFMDCSEQCGFSVEDQVKLFHQIKPLFANKSVMVVINKIDIMKPEDLDEERQALIKTVLESPGVEIMQLSCHAELGIMEVRNKACEKLLTSRIEEKLKGQARVSNVLNKIHLAQPVARDDIERPSAIPDAVAFLKKYDVNDPERRKLARDIEAENGGAGVYNVNLKENYLLENEEWNNDIMPEVLDGKNIYDFIDPEIAAKLQALEDEEEKLEAQGFYASDDEMTDDEEAEIREKAIWIREKHKKMMNAARSRKTIKNKAHIPRKMVKKSMSEMENHLADIGLDSTSISKRARSNVRGSSDLSGQDTIMRGTSQAREKSVVPVLQPNRRDDGVASTTMRSKANRMAKVTQRARNREARQGEADRHQGVSMPKHLFSGKRGIGKTDSR
ncbi:P-loop containing nucleoside triphosphate hydrolase protein [Nadsonia fulvescens var. elongata DSM 6958]|uniref:Nucleolar GTP-binding protein 1 n=1 Tax=Nadsonia fulvescens var. elongata DSM 6958 TaxID=857566 RepID=A0A1E3PRX1_9ASCO|nr:P-loop containing nucleoside triphosphate hydrolase protein [Nadsonia fulvescens var. elongata DSM 6958]